MYDLYENGYLVEGEFYITGEDPGTLNKIIVFDGGIHIIYSKTITENGQTYKFTSRMV